MNRNYKLVFEYNGADFSGSQKQPRVRTVQTEIEKALTKYLRTPVALVLAGRTDRGVHALAQVANFSVPQKTDLKRLMLGLNSILTDDISITGISPAGKDFNARYNATGKVYEYRIWNKPFRTVWGKKYSWHIARKLDFKAMKAAGSYLIGTRDFSAFEASGSTQNNKIASLTRFNIAKRNGYLVFEFRANRFLYKMIRNIVGTIVEAGKGNIQPKDINKILSSKDRKLSGPTAPAHGLFLKRIFYGQQEK